MNLIGMAVARFCLRRCRAVPLCLPASVVKTLNPQVNADNTDYFG